MHLIISEIKVCRCCVCSLATQVCVPHSQTQLIIFTLVGVHSIKFLSQVGATRAARCMLDIQV